MVAEVYQPPPPLPPLTVGVVDRLGRPTTALAWLVRGRALMDAGKAEQASAAFETAMRARRDGTMGEDRAQAPAYFNLAFSYLKRGQYGMAYAPLDAGLRRDPSFAAGWTELGRCYYILRRYDRAVAACREATTRRPDDASAWLIGGLAGVRTTDPNSGLPSLGQVPVLDPTNALAPRVAGEVRLAAGRPAEAELDFRLALHRRPGDRHLRVLLIDSLKRQGRPFAALACWWGGP